MNISHKHNLFKDSLECFTEQDPHLSALAKFRYQYRFSWWQEINLDEPGIYIVTGGRQIGKSTSCKDFIKHCLVQNQVKAKNTYYLACDEVFDAKQLSELLNQFFLEVQNEYFLLVIDEITYVKNWERIIKSFADQGYFTHGICVLTGSDSVMLEEAAMTFPGRRGNAEKIDFHLYPISFHDYVELINTETLTNEILQKYFLNYLKCGGYLKAINDMAEYGDIKKSTYLTYQQWIRGDFLRKGKNEHYLLSLLQALQTIGTSQISYSSLTTKIGEITKETCIDYIRLLKRMDVVFDLPAFDINKKQGSPKKARKFHFVDPFIYRCIHALIAENLKINAPIEDAILAEATAASHCHRLSKTYYFKGQGEVDIIFHKDHIRALEVKWTNQLRPFDLKSLNTFKHKIILSKNIAEGELSGIPVQPICRYLYNLN